MIVDSLFNFNKFTISKNDSFEIDGSIGFDFKSNFKKQKFYVPSGNFEKDIVRTFISKIKTKNINYIENLLIPIKHSQRARRIDFVFEYKKNFFLIDVIKRENEIQKVLRKIKDQLDEISVINGIVLLLSSKIKLIDFNWDSHKPFMIKWLCE